MAIFPLLRPYLVSDRAACVGLFEGNVPAYFGEHEKDDFLRCIDQEIDPYFVLEDGRGQLAGYGGYAVHPAMPATAGLTWGMIRRDLHGQGLGRCLLTGRLERIRAEGRFTEVRIETTPMSRGFARFGFLPIRTQSNGFGRGYDLVEMSLSIG